MLFPFFYLRNRPARFDSSNQPARNLVEYFTLPGVEIEKPFARPREKLT